MDNREKNNRLEDLLKELYNDSSLNDMDHYINGFKEIYCENFRHEYSRITKFLITIDDSESADMLISKIDTIQNAVQNSVLENSLDKLKDHITLENIRLSKLRDLSEANKSYSDVLTECNKLSDSIQKLEKRTESIDDKTGKMDDKLYQNTIQSITILGIFSGVVMAFTGGISFIASSLQNINAISKYRLIFVIMLLSMGIFNIIFMLIYAIGKLTGKYIGSKCNCDNPFIGCDEKSVNCAVVRYPFVVWINLFYILSLILLTILYTIDRYNLIAFFMQKISISTVVAFILAITALIVFNSILFIIIKKLINVQCKYEESQGFFYGVGSLLGKHFVKKS